MTVCSSNQIRSSRLTKAPFSQSRNALLAYSSLSVTHMSTKRPEHLSQSTHTRILSTVWRHGAPNSPLLQTYVQQTELGAQVCHPSCCLRPFLNGSNRIFGGAPHTYMITNTHTSTDTQGRAACLGVIIEV